MNLHCNYSIDSMDLHCNCSIDSMDPGLKKILIKKKKRIFFYLNQIFFIHLIFFKSGIHVIKYLTIRLSGVNTAKQV